MESVGDQSSYVGELVKHVNGKTQEVLSVVAKQQYARAFADNLVEHLASTYISNIVQCRPISEVGAEQMLLDKHYLTKAFENLLSFHNPSPSTPYAPPASFVKRVTSTMTRIDPLLKTLQVRPSPPEGLVQAYLIHIGDRSDANFKKILELKGVRKQDQPHLLELFTIHRDSPSNTNLTQQSPLLTPLMNPSNLGNSGVSTVGNNASAALNAAQGAAKFDATTLGERLLSAARDASERVGTGPGTPTPNINENLKNIGKFFRRDMGGFGARFGKRDGSVDDNAR